MKTSRLIGLLAVLAGLQAGATGNESPTLTTLMKDAKISLLDGIALAERTSGPAVSAKFEIGDDDKLSLSIYTVPEGLGVEPETATLTELSGDPTAAAFKFGSEVFKDKEHIARASVHMTLFQLSKYTLKQAIEMAVKKVGGVAIDVHDPMVRNKRPVADVLVMDDDGDETSLVTVDLLDGQTQVKAVKKN